MPIYEYICAECNEEFETLVLNPDEQVSCPKCGSKNAKRNLSCFATSAGAPGQACAPGGGFT